MHDAAEAPRYLTSPRAVTDCEFWVIDADVFGAQIRVWFPMAMHMLEGMTLGFRSSQAIIGQRERLLSLGRLSAGLTHELNNPAAAAVRATAALRERVSKMRAQACPPGHRRRRPQGAGRADRAAGGGGREDGQGRQADARWRSATPRTSSATGWTTTASPTPGTWRRRWSPPGSNSGWLDEIADTLPAGVAARRHPLGHLRAGHRAADGGDRGLDPPDLRPGRRGQAVLTDGPGRARRHRRPRRPDQHHGDAAAQDQAVRKHQRGQGLAPTCP